VININSVAHNARSLRLHAGAPLTLSLRLGYRLPEPLRA
jgi:hypothetical protein